MALELSYQILNSILPVAGNGLRGPNELALLKRLDERVKEGLTSMGVTWGPDARSKSREELCGFILAWSLADRKVAEFTKRSPRTHLAPVDIRDLVARL